MKPIFILILLCFGFNGLAQDINVLSYNIRFNNPSDRINAWPNRVEMVAGLLRFHSVEIFGMQEVLYDQLIDIENRFPGFGRIGTGRDDGQKAGEFSPVFYRKDRFELLENGQFWLSTTPDKPGLGWDAACNRICTWGKFKHKSFGKVFLMLNTHFDHVGDTARANSAMLISKFIKEISGNESIPVILTGDFNLTPDKLPIQLIKKELHDSRDISKETPYGPIGTFNGFQHDSPLTERIDYIFVNNKVSIIKYATLTDSKDNRYPSDHLPVFVKAALK